MLANDPTWKKLREWISWTAKHAQLEMIATSVLFPILECVFVNLYTGAQPGQATPFLVAIIGLAVVHAGLIAILLIRQNTNPVQITADTIELKESLERVTRDAEERVRLANEQAKRTTERLSDELLRKTEAHQMLRSVLDAFNLQTCQMEPEAPDAFYRGLLPIIQKVACGAHRTLEIKHDKFTIELYCLDPSCHGLAEHINHISDEKLGPLETAGAVFDGYVEPALFFSTWGLNPRQLNLMGPGSAFYWGWARGVPGTCSVVSDQRLFYEGDRPRPGLYFRNVATVPVRLVCMPDCIGILAVTSMQEQSFSTDILDSVVSGDPGS